MRNVRWFLTAFFFSAVFSSTAFAQKYTVYHFPQLVRDFDGTTLLTSEIHPLTSWLSAALHNLETGQTTLLPLPADSVAQAVPQALGDEEVIVELLGENVSQNGTYRYSLADRTFVRIDPGEGAQVTAVSPNGQTVAGIWHGKKERAVWLRGRRGALRTARIPEEVGFVYVTGVNSEGGIVSGTTFIHGQITPVYWSMSEGRKGEMGMLPGMGTAVAVSEGGRWIGGGHRTGLGASVACLYDRRSRQLSFVDGIEGARSSYIVAFDGDVAYGQAEYDHRIEIFRVEGGKARFLRPLLEIQDPLVTLVSVKKGNLAIAIRHEDGRMTGAVARPKGARKRF